MPALPIDDALPALRQALNQRDEVVLEAPPGAGKTTQVPLALLNESWLDGQAFCYWSRADWPPGPLPSA